MQYEPIKSSLGRFFRRSLFLKKILYFLLDLLLLRSWHVRKTIQRFAVGLPNDSTVLDAGSGFGQYSWRMSSHFPGWKIKGIDINKEWVAECNEFFSKAGRSDRVTFETGDLTHLAGTNSYNLILTVDVMEHIEADEKVFSNFHRALRDDGVLIISTPSDKGGSDVHNHNESSFIDEHVRDGYGKEEIIKKLADAGFRSADVRYTYGKAGGISWILSMKYPVKMINASKLFFIILPFYYLIFFPVSFLLNIIDVNSKHESGTGLLVTARK
jgi:2-polyprenyl-3-methyl-5-hydroxy-6-metoxy-1,4-benzoquinol methylase